MLTSRSKALFLRRLVPALVATVLQVACQDATSPTSGGIRVTVISTGEDIDPDGYAVRRDDGTTIPIAANGEVTYEGVANGRHRLRLIGIASNCTPDGGETQQALVEGSATASATFRIFCVPRVGIVHVTTITTGVDRPTAHTLTVDGGDPFTFGVNDSRTVAQLREGAHSVTLGTLPPNCALQGTARRDVQVTFGHSANVEFRVDCSPITGALRVTVGTTGAPSNPDGYRVDVIIPDFYYPTTVASQAIGQNGSVTFPAIPVGEYQLVLVGVPAWCTVAGQWSMVRIVGNTSADVALAVQCAPPATLRISAATSGADPDPDGYRVRITGGNLYEFHPLASNASVDRAGLGAGSYQLQIEGVANNCTLVGESEREVEVAAGSVATVLFEVRCQARGSLRLTNVTSGTDPDLDGFEVVLYGLANTMELTLPAGGQVVGRDLAPGEYDLIIRNVAENCAPLSATRRKVVIQEGREATIAFDVSCTLPTRLAFASFRSGDAEIYTARSDGTGLIRLTTNNARDDEAAWSPDGRRIAFISDRSSSGSFDIYVMNADGSGVVRRTSTGQASSPAWSPDGRTLAFVSVNDGDHEIYTISADDAQSAVVRLTDNREFDGEPSWSPDGRIAFASAVTGNATLWVMNADGTGRMALSRNQGALHYRNPVWSPDGASIAFASIDCSYPYYYYCSIHISVMNADGSGVRQLAVASEPRATWSPDSRTIAFTGWYEVNEGVQPAIMYVRADGSHHDLIIANGLNPAWQR